MRSSFSLRRPLGPLHFLLRRFRASPPQNPLMGPTGGSHALMVDFAPLGDDRPLTRQSVGEAREA